jgi:hypothetical protein
MKKGVGSTGNLWTHFRNKHQIPVVNESNTNQTFKKEEFNEKLIEWIVEEMHPYTIAEEKGFNNIIKYLNPLVNSITGDTVKAKIDLTFELEIKEIITELQKLNSKPSFTLDCWTSMNTTAYLGVTIHYINEDFEIKKYLLDFVLLKEKQSGAILAEEFVIILKS